jgi:penicillin-binding protein 2
MQVALLVFLLGLLGCIMKLAWLQVWQHPKYLAESLSSLTTEELVPAPRGRILDSTGKIVLAEDSPRFDIAVRVKDLKLREVVLYDVRKNFEVRKAASTPYFRAVKARENKDPAAPSDGDFALLTAEWRAAEEEYRRQRDDQVSRLAGREPLVAEIGELTGLPRDGLARGLVGALEHVAKDYEGAPPPIATNVERTAWDRLYLRQHCALLSGDQPPFPGIVLLTNNSRRRYPEGTTACHILGYVSMLNTKQYEALADHPEGLKLPKTLSPSDEDAFLFKPSPGERLWLVPHGGRKVGRALPDERIGVSGVEYAYNQELRGEHAYRVVERKIQPSSWRGGELVKEYSDARPHAGTDLRLTIEMRAQLAAEKALAESGHPGAMVFLDPASGAVLALASYPPFDPNLLTTGRGEDIVALMKDPAKPLFCRPTQAGYPPGSTFKPFLSVGAIQEGNLRPEGTTYTCSQVLHVGNRDFECLGSHGTIDFLTAMRKSCNIYFYHVGLVQGGERMGKWGRAEGLGERTGIDLPGEFAGLMPSPAWKRQYYKGQRGMTSWTDGDSCNTAIGQGVTLVTPLQSAVAMAAIANGGRLVRPHLFTREGVDYTRRTMEVSPATMEIVRKALRGVVNDSGTGRLCMMRNVVVCGKTGSAEHSPKGSPTHAWFCGFAGPGGDPTVAFAVLLESAGHGGASAAPAARKVLEAMFGSDEAVQATGEERD